MFLLAAVIFGFCVKQIAEPDIWWHLRDARHLLQYHSFPRTDTFSYTAAGLFRPNIEWLSEIPYFLLFRKWGLRGILALYFAILVLIYAGVYYRSCRYGADCKDATVTTLIAIFLGVVSIGPRMLLFGWLCMVILLLILDRFRRTGKGLWLVPPLFLLWINLHGSWIFGIIVLVLTIAAGLVEGEWSTVIAQRWKPDELKHLYLIFAASIGALFINPFGYWLVLYPFDLQFRQGSAMQYVEEWQSTNFSSPSGKLMLLVVFGLFAAMLLSKLRWRLDELLLIAFSLSTALLHTRFLFFAGIIILPILAARLSLFSPYERQLDKPWLNAAIMLGMLGCLILLFPSNEKLEQKVSDCYPRAALDFIEARHLDGRIFNQYVWGGYLEWYAPQIKTFIDGRADIFVYSGALRDHQRATSIEAPLEVLDKYKIDYALLQPDRPLTYLFEHSSAWRQIYNDEVAEVFERVPASKSVSEEIAPVE